MSTSQYVPLLKALRGRPVALEVGDETRQAVELVGGHIWDLFYEDSVLLVIRFKDEHVDKAAEAITAEMVPYNAQLAAYNQAKQANANAAVVAPIKPLPFVPHREWQFKWILTSNIISVESDAHVKIDIITRKFERPKPEPLYSDGKKYWYILNNNISKHIVAKLKELGLTSTFDGVYRNDDNEALESAHAQFAVPQAPVNVAPIAVPPIPAPQAVPVQAQMAPVGAPV